MGKSGAGGLGHGYEPPGSRKETLAILIFVAVVVGAVVLLARYC